MENIFLQFSILLGITVSVAFVIRMLRQPLIVAYILAGIISGPVFLNVVQGSENILKSFAQFGIVLLLFVVGLNLNLKHLKFFGKDIFVGGSLQFLFTAGFGALIMSFLGFSWISSLFVAICITFSSTIVVVKLLSDKRDLESVYGRYVVGLLVIQDLIAIGLLMFLNGSPETGLPWQSELILTFSKVGLLGIGVYLAAKALLPKIIEPIAHSNELLFIFTIGWCFGVASLVHAAGFSIEIGAIIAGATLGSSKFQSELSSRIKPLRDFFIVLFFIVLGSELHFGQIAGAIVPSVLISAFVLIVDPIILFGIMRQLGYTRRNAFLIGITAAQVSEFAFILAVKGKEVGYLGELELAILTLVALLTITVSSYLIEYNEAIYKKLIPFFHLFGKDKAQKGNHEIAEETYDVIVFGYHRMGWKICEGLLKDKKKFAVVDFNPTVITHLRQKGISCFFGDASDTEFLGGLPFEKAKMIISTIPDPQDGITLVEHIRTRTTTVPVIATLFHRGRIDELYKAGANFVMLPHLLGGHWLVDVLEEKPWTDKTFQTFRKEQKEDLRQRFTSGI
jgi:Kef-type K+ transport system membrane component KefB